MNLKERLFKEGIESCHLDTLVHDEASQQATGVNNDGIDRQLEYLQQAGWSEKDILDKLDIKEQE